MPGDTIRNSQFEHAFKDFNWRIIEGYLKQEGVQPAPDVILWAEDSVRQWLDFDAVMRCIEALVAKHANDPRAWGAFLEAHFVRKIFPDPAHELVMVKRCYKLMPALVKESITAQLCKAFETSDEIIDFLFEIADGDINRLAHLVFYAIGSSHLLPFLHKMVRDHQGILQAVFEATIKVYDKDFERVCSLGSLMKQFFLKVDDQGCLDWAYVHLMSAVTEEVRALRFRLLCRYGSVYMVDRVINDAGCTIDLDTPCDLFFSDDDADDERLLGQYVWEELTGGMFSQLDRFIGQREEREPLSFCQRDIDHLVILWLLLSSARLELDGCLWNVQNFRKSAKQSFDQGLIGGYFFDLLSNLCDILVSIQTLQSKQEGYESYQGKIGSDCPWLSFETCYQFALQSEMDHLARVLDQIESVMSRKKGEVHQYYLPQVESYQVACPTKVHIEKFFAAFEAYASRKKIITAVEQNYLGSVCSIARYELGLDRVRHRKLSGHKGHAWRDANDEDKYVVIHDRCGHELPLVTTKEDSREAACDKIVLALLTSLFYHLKSSPWGAAVCVELRQWIAMIRDDLPEGTDQEDYKAAHEALEARGYCAE